MAKDPSDVSAPDQENADEDVVLADSAVISALSAQGREHFNDVAKDHLNSPLVWALLAEGALLTGSESSDMAAYPYASTGVFLGKQLLEEAGWQPGDTLLWQHLPNQGLIRAMRARAQAARRLGAEEESTQLWADLEELCPDLPQ